MITSLFLKFGMLTVTIGIVLWIGWMRQSPVHPPVLSTEGQTTASFNRSTYHEPDQRIKPIDSATISQLQGQRLLDLNRANADELERLPGIGAVLAQRVIAFRESMGRFQKIEDLREVKGIGAKKFDRLKSFVTVSTGNTQRETEQRRS